ncbi:hypothetical protein IAT40_002410 [Kwoniella sp. CBS 6097]
MTEQDYLPYGYRPDPFVPIDNSNVTAVEVEGASITCAINPDLDPPSFTYADPLTQSSVDITCMAVSANGSQGQTKTTEDDFNTLRKETLKAGTFTHVPGTWHRVTSTTAEGSEADIFVTDKCLDRAVAPSVSPPAQAVISATQPGETDQLRKLSLTREQRSSLQSSHGHWKNDPSSAHERPVRADFSALGPSFNDSTLHCLGEGAVLVPHTTADGDTCSLIYLSERLPPPTTEKDDHTTGIKWFKDNSRPKTVPSGNGSHDGKSRCGWSSSVDR